MSDMKTQTEAQWIADRLDLMNCPEAAREMRRLEAANTDLLKALSALVSQTNSTELAASFDMARSAMVKAQGQTMKKMAFKASKDFEPVCFETQDELDKFLSLVMDECAKVCDELILDHPGRADLTAIQCAAAIRAMKPE